MAQEPLNATFFAFRKREEGGGVLLGASIGYAVLILIVFAAMSGAVWLLLGGESFFAWYRDVMNASVQGGEASAPPISFSSIVLMVPVYFIFLALVFMVFAAFESACLRWMIRGERSGPLNLHFGADMWRVYGTYWGWFVYVTLGWFGLFILTFVSTAVSIGVDGAGPWIGFALICGYLIAWFWVTVRLSPASATSVGIGEFKPLMAWRVTGGRFWSIFGAYFLLWILYMFIISVASAVMLGGFYAAVFANIDVGAAQTDPEGFFRAYENAVLGALEQMFSTPTMMALYVASQIVLYVIAIMFYLLWFGVQARAVEAALAEGKITRAGA